MAAGDEQLDYDDRVVVMNRVIDAPVEIMFAGRIMRWEPAQKRSVQRQEAISHYIPKSTVLWDPVNMTAPIQKLVMINELEDAIQPGASTDPLDAATCAELSKFGIVDDSNLPEDRYTDAETGEALPHRELRRVTRGPNDFPRGRRLQPLDRTNIDRELERVHRDHAL